MATLTGSISLLATISLGNVSTSLDRTGIGAHAIGEAPISSQTSISYVTSGGPSGRLIISIATAPSASITLASDSEIRRYKVGATSTQGLATLSTAGHMKLRGQTHGHQGIEGASTLTATIRGPVHGVVHFQARAGLFETLKGSAHLQASATLIANGRVFAFDRGAVNLHGIATLSGKGSLQTTPHVRLDPFANLNVSSFVKLGFPYGTLYPSGLGFFIQGGIEKSTTLFTKGPMPHSFDSAMPEEGGDQKHRPAPPLFIDGKGVASSNEQKLFLENTDLVEDSPSTYMNLHMAGRNFSPISNSANLFIANGVKFIETGFRGRFPEVPLFLKAQDSFTMDPVTMNLFIGPLKTPVWHTTLFIKADGPVSGVPTLFVNGLNYTNPDMDLYLRGPLEGTTTHTNLHIQGY